MEFSTIKKYVLGFIKPLIGLVSSILMYYQGRKSMEASATKEHLKDAIESKNLKEHIKSLPESDVDNILSNHK